MKKLVCLFFAAALGLAAGCASQQSATGAGSTSGNGGTSGGITVFGTVDGGVSGTRNR